MVFINNLLFLAYTIFIHIYDCFSIMFNFFNFFFFGDHNGNKFYNFLCYPRLFRQYVHVIFIIIIYIFVCSYYVLIIRTVRFCQINQIKSNQIYIDPCSITFMGVIKK